MIPGMVNVLEQCLTEGDEESAGEIFEVFDTLLMLVSWDLAVGLSLLDVDICCAGYCL